MTGPSPVDRASPARRSLCCTWLFGYRRISIRYERYANHLCAFLTLAAMLTCYKNLRKAAT